MDLSDTTVIVTKSHPPCFGDTVALYTSIMKFFYHPRSNANRFLRAPCMAYALSSREWQLLYLEAEVVICRIHGCSTSYGSSAEDVVWLEWNVRFTSRTGICMRYNQKGPSIVLHILYMLLCCSLYQDTMKRYHCCLWIEKLHIRIVQIRLTLLLMCTNS